MADKKMSELSQTINITGEELVPILIDGQNKVVKTKYLKGADNLTNEYVDLTGDDGNTYRMKVVNGKDAFTIKKALIEMRKDQYIIKNAYRKPIVPVKLTRSKYKIKLDEDVKIFDDDGYPIPEGISLMNPEICSCILCNYSRLKEDSWDRFEDDTWYLIYDFENICDEALADYPMLMRIVECKIDGLQNIEIQKILQEEFNITHSLEYISSLFRNKIPKLIADKAVDKYLEWYYTTQEKGKYKKCSRCGQIK